MTQVSPTKEQQTAVVLPTSIWPIPFSLESAFSPDTSSSSSSSASSRIWIDGCFDGCHHGHAGACLQARRLGSELYVGIHSDSDILQHKGPTIMTLAERVAAIEACRWVTKAVPHAPYVTNVKWVDFYHCDYVGHGDDVTRDSEGKDCYRYVKEAGRFKVFNRTPGISTTDLVGRMLLCTRTHFIPSLEHTLADPQVGPEMMDRIVDYSTDESATLPSSDVWTWTPTDRQTYWRNLANPTPTPDDGGQFKPLVKGKSPRIGQRIVYVDGGFDLFSSGHIAFLKKVHEEENRLATQSGSWFTQEAKQARIKESGEDYAPVYVVAGVHDDQVINHFKELNYPIMNIFERGLCVLQCRYIHAVIFSAPFVPTETFLRTSPFGQPSRVYHGPTSFMSPHHPQAHEDPYFAAKQLGIFFETPTHDFMHVNADEIVSRIYISRAMYEERQRRKGMP